eukprot:6867295-Prymnesium_polylepis.1
MDGGRSCDVSVGGRCAAPCRRELRNDYAPSAPTADTAPPAHPPRRLPAVSTAVRGPAGVRAV